MGDNINRYLKAFGYGVAGGIAGKVTSAGISKVGDLLADIPYKLINPQQIRNEMLIGMNRGNQRRPYLLDANIVPAPGGPELTNTLSRYDIKFPIPTSFRPNTSQIFDNQIRVQGLGSEYGTEALTTLRSGTNYSNLPSTIRSRFDNSLLQTGIPIGASSPPNLGLFVPYSVQPSIDLEPSRTATTLLRTRKKYGPYSKQRSINLEPAR